ncbi:FIST signal transduction protein [Marinifilum sp. D714]|uniref:FIST signal transduction protein n=1 Tax=Marinifilum sp. D714 TaxID=2937523 RepID=UPI0027CB32B8|nr:FIST C-terminal domain-containing protein [Marinifilum sp. D714]MDQ2177820.1 FIST C-terminal domain-containing protein [Marinifilum sp. D714]
MYLEKPTINSILKGLKELSVSDNTQFLLLIGENCKLNLEKLVLSLNKAKHLFIGGVFPKVIYKSITSDTGIIIKKINFDVVPIYFNSEEEFLSQFASYHDRQFTTAFTLIDGLSEKASDHLTTLFTHLGNNVRFFGGGVGCLETKDKGILLTNDGVFNTGTIIVFLNSNTRMDAKHGWQKSEGPFIVTKSEKNLIKELNWENAFDVYQKCLKETQNLNLTKENFSSHSIHFPFGIYKEDRDYIVRDPFEVNSKGYITCVGNIPENSLIDILAIEQDTLESISSTMISNCVIESKNNPIALIFSCISRVKHLQTRFDDELVAFNNEIITNFPHCELEGALSIGEIYSSGNGYLELLNKSVVLGLAY